MSGNSDGSVSFRAHANNQLVTADNAGSSPLIANRTAVGPWESFDLISNADGKIDAVLQRCGIEDCFASIIDSGKVGHEKPYPAIFEMALREMKAAAAKSLYVGDVYSVDYVGARNAGMQAVLFDVAGAYREREFPRVESLVGLEDWLKQ